MKLTWCSYLFMCSCCLRNACVFIIINYGTSSFVEMKFEVQCHVYLCYNFILCVNYVDNDYNLLKGVI